MWQTEVNGMPTNMILVHRVRLANYVSLDPPTLPPRITFLFWDKHTYFAADPVPYRGAKTYANRGEIRGTGLQRNSSALSGRKKPVRVKPRRSLAWPRN